MALAGSPPDVCSQLPQQAGPLGIRVRHRGDQEGPEVAGPGGPAPLQLREPPLPEQVLLEDLPGLVALGADVDDPAHAVGLGVRPEAALQLLDARHHGGRLMEVLVPRRPRVWWAMRGKDPLHRLLKPLQVALLGGEQLLDLLDLLDNGRDCPLHSSPRRGPEEAARAHRGERKGERRLLAARGRPLIAWLGPAAVGTRHAQTQGLERPEAKLLLEFCGQFPLAACFQQPVQREQGTHDAPGGTAGCVAVLRLARAPCPGGGPRPAAAGIAALAAALGPAGQGGVQDPQLRPEHAAVAAPPRVLHQALLGVWEPSCWSWPGRVRTLRHH
mmetsp:Transcript_55624/g.172947  ORF Transcript_55624/g.172947 Transcript_55624/m.172947 type:complete len:329 (-) Transcript_55624:1478-2464(-)